MFVGLFCPPGSGSGLRILIRIRIQGLNPDPIRIRIRILHSTASTLNLPQEKKEWREVIEKRLLMPTFADEDTLLFPEDPLGRHGPR